LYYSSDEPRGKTSPDATLNTIRFINNHTAIAAGQNKMIRIRFNKKTLYYLIAVLECFMNNKKSIVLFFLTFIAVLLK
jgi:hypothetical protein